MSASLLHRCLILAARPLENKLQAIAFVATIAVLAVFSVCVCLQHNRLNEISEVENRVLSNLPAFSSAGANFREYAAAFEKFYEDRFAGRLSFQRVRSFVLYKLFNTSASPQVVLGQRRRLFLFTEDLSTHDAFSDEQLQNWIQLFRGRRDLLAQRGIKYILMIVPEKGTVEPYNLPKTVQALPKASRYRQMRALLTKADDLTTVDLLPIFEAERYNRDLYYWTDSHWNNTGALLAARALAKALVTKFPSDILKSQAQSLDNLKFANCKWSGDLAQMLNLKDIVSETTGNVDYSVLQAKKIARDWEHRKTLFVKPEVETVQTNKDLPAAFFLHDSFTLVLQPFSSELFSRVIYHRDHALPVEEIFANKPDVVVEELAERYFYNLGVLDKYPFGSYPFYPVKQQFQKNVDNNSRVLANFVCDDCIHSLHSELLANKLNVQIGWRALKEQIGNKVVLVRALNDAGKVISSANYVQNPSFCIVSPQTEWTDEIDLTIPTHNVVDRIDVSLQDSDGHRVVVKSSSLTVVDNRILFQCGPL